MQLVRLTKQMQARGHLLTPAPREELRQRRVSCPRHRRRTPLHRRKVQPPRHPALAAAARRHKAELIQSTLSSARLMVNGSKPSAGPLRRTRPGLLPPLPGTAASRTLIAVSQAVKDDMVAQGFAAERITVMRNALAPEEFVPKRAPLEVRQEFGADAGPRSSEPFGHLSRREVTAISSRPSRRCSSSFRRPSSG